MARSGTPEIDIFRITGEPCSGQPTPSFPFATSPTLAEVETRAAGLKNATMAVVERGGGLVGREAVLGVAEAALDEMLSGAGQLLLVTGEPGMGKSAVLTEVARRGSHRGARVLRGVCWRGDGA